MTDLRSALASVVALAVLTACGGGREEPAPEPVTRTSEAPDAGPWETVVDEGTGIRFDFPVAATPVEGEQVVAGRRFPTYTYAHRTGGTELVVVLEDVGLRLRLVPKDMVRMITGTLEGAGDGQIRCGRVRGDARRLRTTCRSVDETGRERISMGIALAFREVVSTSIVAHTADPDEGLHAYQVSGAAKKIADSMRAGGRVV
ncbi:hypothetical protein [Nocardioides ganghwensis]|jgi:hypothetical protein|uniref:Uncharacterized protein n=1 Tax=Nocardioides ganghwensis TaxID=252230 RepID=A0A4Q2SFQ7_9ACTN|nr:hypothetical protein [Nocardioides ganghwensis]MBD3944517.1 hypothetical protein [Nocardioides ganghwensis]RYC04276.1 hypothetical protein EUA07_01985 [Nocardioides ganghwensis]